MADDSATREPPAAPIGRVRLTDPDAPPATEVAVDQSTGEGWSVAGVAVALLIILIMVGALVVILWAVFQSRA